MIYSGFLLVCLAAAILPQSEAACGFESGSVFPTPGEFPDSTTDKTIAIFRQIASDTDLFESVRFNDKDHERYFKAEIVRHGGTQETRSVVLRTGAEFRDAYDDTGIRECKPKVTVKCAGAGGEVDLPATYQFILNDTDNQAPHFDELSPRSITVDLEKWNKDDIINQDNPIAVIDRDRTQSFADGATYTVKNATGAVVTVTHKDQSAAYPWTTQLELRLKENTGNGNYSVTLEAKQGSHPVSTHNMYIVVQNGANQVGGAVFMVTVASLIASWIRKY